MTNGAKFQRAVSVPKNRLETERMKETGLRIKTGKNNHNKMEGCEPYGNECP